MRKILLVVLACIFIFSVSACSPAGEAVASETPETSIVAETPPANTPEESTVSSRPPVSDDIEAQDICVLKYFDALKTNNADKIIQISSGSLVGENMKAQTGSDFLGELYSMTSISNTLKSTWYLIYSILSDFAPETAIRDYSEDTINEFIQGVDPSRLAELEVLALGTPREPLELSSYMQMDSNTLSQRVCLFSFQDQIFYQTFWLVNSPGGYKLAAIGDYNDDNIRSYAQAVDRDQFEALVDPQTIDEPSQQMLASSAEIGSETTFLQKFKGAAFPAFQNVEEVIGFFAGSVARGDVYAALSTFCIREEVLNNDSYSETKYLGAFMPYRLSLMVSDYDFYQDINLAIKCSEKAADIISFIGFFSINIDTDSTAEQFFAALQKSCAAIDSLSVVRCDAIAKSINEGRETNLRQAAYYGADDLQHWIVEYNFNSDPYTGAAMVMRYDGWKIWTLTSVYLDFPQTLCPVVPSGQIDYDSFI